MILRELKKEFNNLDSYLQNIAGKNAILIDNRSGHGYILYQQFTMPDIVILKELYSRKELRIAYSDSFRGLKLKKNKTLQSNNEGSNVVHTVYEEDIFIQDAIDKKYLKYKIDLIEDIKKAYELKIEKELESFKSAFEILDLIKEKSINQKLIEDYASLKEKFKDSNSDLVLALKTANEIYNKLSQKNIEKYSKGNMNESILKKKQHYYEDEEAVVEAEG